MSSGCPETGFFCLGEEMSKMVFFRLGIFLWKIGQVEAQFFTGGDSGMSGRDVSGVCSGEVFFGKGS